MQSAHFPLCSCSKNFPLNDSYRSRILHTRSDGPFINTSGSPSLNGMSVNGKVKQPRNSLTRHSEKRNRKYFAITCLIQVMEVSALMGALRWAGTLNSSNDGRVTSAHYSPKNRLRRLKLQLVKATGLATSRTAGERENGRKRKKEGERSTGFSKSARTSQKRSRSCKQRRAVGSRSPPTSSIGPRDRSSRLTNFFHCSLIDGLAEHLRSMRSSSCL